ncbi:MAG: multidrug effflux MFS transporter [Rhodoferax sp.]|nr:multidrug effflux MFS transporter [Rhodoferax sp.]HRA61244.1 multidrug effflux MFS transporter [Burkholderiaceae bacterium]
MNSSFLRIALVLGLLSAVGPFSIDMYLPALPSIGTDMDASIGAVQASLMAYFVAMGAGQIIYGPVSDMVGRRLPMYFGLTLFCIGSVGCALAPDVHSLIALRFVQGLGACACVVIPRAIVRDLYTGHEAARVMALLMLVFSVSPILAPLAGSLLVEFSGWRSIFWVIAAIAVAALVLVATSLRETRPKEQRSASGLRSALAAYGVLLRDRTFLGMVFIGAFGVSSFFTYLANSPFVLITHFGLSSRQYGLAFAVNAAAFIGASQLTGRFGKRLGLARLVKFAMVGYAAAMLSLLLLNLLGVDRLVPLLVLLFIGFGFLGLAMPSSAVLALDRHGAIAGTASALMGMFQFVTGALVMAAVGLFVDGSSRPMVVGIGTCAVLALVISHLTLSTASPQRHTA